ncbi:unnamed protein product, partial [Gongylonema pulchrum]|uniref:Ig-like domain-containing protein n=1 Tax=Gongylonema pulchrum TaxID=637853 RepID=A0A183D2L0_9BILA
SEEKSICRFKDGKEIAATSDKNKLKKISDTVYQLEIPNIGKDAGAAYKLKITKGLEDQKADKGQKVVLSVEVNTPPKQIKWYKNGKEIAPIDKPKPKKIDDNKYQLEIPDVDKDDVAEYKARFTFIASKVHFLISKNFCSKFCYPVVLATEDNETADSACSLTVKLPTLTITKGLEDQEAGIGDKVVLGVEVSAPPKSIKWYKNGKEIKPSDKAKPRKVNDTKYELEIPDASKDDTADYKVVLTSEDDETVDSSCALTVKFPTLTITKGLEDQEAKVGDKVVLGVEVSALPKSIKWYYLALFLDLSSPFSLNFLTFKFDFAFQFCFQR